MKKTLYIVAASTCLTCGVLLSAHAQAPGIAVDLNSNGVGIIGKTTPNITGSPYINTEWVRGVVKMTDGTIYKNLKLNYNQIDDRPIFIADNKALQYFANPVKEFVLVNITNDDQTTKIFRNGFPILDDATTSSFYQILSEGKATLIKRATKKMVEERGAGSIMVSKQIQENSKYYLVVNEQYTRIKKDKKSILDVLKDKKDELTAYLNANHLSLKDDGDLIRLCDYYNTL